MTDTNFTIPKKVFIFENGVTDGFIVLKVFPFDVIVKSKTKNLAEAKLRLTSVLRDQVGANAALRLHFDEKLFGGSYVAKIALIKKLNKKQRGVDEREVTNSLSRVLENIKKVSVDQNVFKRFVYRVFAFVTCPLLFLVNISDPSFLKLLLEFLLLNAVFFFLFNKWYGGKLLDPYFIYIYKEQTFIQVK